ncbi:hypothetical protein ACW2Q0_29590 [Nocardia sp. R16R-3T]
MNLDFSADPLFSWYVILLLVSGIALIAMSYFKTQSAGMRAFDAIVGVLFFGYGFYLAFVFEGGTYFLVFKAFILPVILVFQFFRSRWASNDARRS